MKNSYDIRAKKFIRMIDPYIGNADSIGFIKVGVSLFNTKYHRAVQFTSGYTRCVLITSDYVIKIDYRTDSQFGNCETELNMYERAIKDGFSYLFAKIERYTYNNHDYYIMPRIKGIDKYEDDVYEYLNCEENNYLYEMVEDLHSGNYGWKNGYPVIIDYACNCA